jgi:hypothetical protein
MRLIDESNAEANILNFMKSSKDAPASWGVVTHTVES